MKIISAASNSKKETSNNIKIVQPSYEYIEKSRNNALLSAIKIENGKLGIDKEKESYARNYSSVEAHNMYKSSHPELYEAMGGIQYFPKNAPVVNGYDLAKSQEAEREVVERYNKMNQKEINNIIDVVISDKWIDNNTMKNFSNKIVSYVNDYIALSEMGYFNNLSDEERKRNNDSLKDLKKYVKYKQQLYGLYSTEKEYTALNDVRFLPREEQCEMVDNYKYAVETLKEINGNIETVRKNLKKTDSFEKPKNFNEYYKNNLDEDVDKWVEFFVDWYKEKGSFDGARESRGADLGYITNGKYDKKEENSTYLIDQAERKARIIVKYGDEDYIKYRAEKLLEYWENTNLTKEFEKYYNEMNADAKAEEYISKGRKIYKTKNKNISNEEYDVTCYYLGKGQKNNYYFTWLKDAVYKREVAASGGWSSVYDGESLKYHRLWSDYTKDAPLEANVTSVALNLGSGIEFAYNTLNGEVKESKLSKASSKIRESYSNTHDWNILGFDAHDFLYNATMSGIDSFAATALGGTSKISGAMLGLSAAAAGVNDALKRGMSDEQAFWNGLMSGAFECFFETCSIEKFKKLQQSAGATFKNAIKNLAKSMLTNASEEALTEIANITYDIVANGDLSHYQLTIQRYMDSGLSESQAKGKAIKQLAGQVLEATASGAFIGLGFGSVGNISSAFNAYAYGKSYYGWSQKSINALVGNGLAMPEGSEAYKLAVKAEGKLKSDKNISGGALYNLATAIKSEIENKSVDRFNEYGVNKKTAKELSPVVAKAVFGEQLTSQEHETLKNNKTAAQVVNELSADRSNTIWKDAIKNRSVNFSASSNKNNILHSENNDNIINTIDDDYVDANANTKDIIKTRQADVLSNISGESHRIYNESYENKALNELELTAILNYKSSASYIINDVLRNSENLSDAETEFVRNLDDALFKMPTYQGAVYRNIAFDWFGGQEAYDAFLSEHKVGYVVDYSAFTSASIKEDGYLVDGRFAVSMVLESRSAKNVDGYGNNFESEVIFPRNSVFVVNDVKYNDIGQPIIYMTEVIKNDEGKHGQFYSKERSEAVQSLSKSQPRYSDLQDISDDNTTRRLDRKNYLQRVSGNERGLNYFDYTITEKLRENFEDKVELRFLELGVDKKAAKELSPVVAKAVFGEQLTSQEHETLKNNKTAAQVVNELSADRSNTIWKDAIKNRSVNFSASSNKNNILHSENYDNIINTIDDDYVDANANTKDIEKTRQADVLSNISGESHRIYNESYENKALNELELTAVMNYKSSASYIINDVLRNSENLSDAETEFVRNMDDALFKMPTYQGTVYRNIAFDWFGGQEAYDAFLSEHKVHDFVTYLAYTSASTKVDGYLVDGHFAVSMVIESRNAKNVDGYGNNFESEVIFPRNSVFVVNNVEYSDKGQPIIYMTEVMDNDEGKHGQFYPKERSETVQSLQKSISWKRKSKLQDISDDNTTRRLDRKNYLQRVSGNERGLNYFDYTITEKLRENFEDKVELRFLELGVDKKAAKELSPVVAKAVFGEQLTSQEHETLKNNKMAAQIVKELSADRANTVWKDAIKNSRTNNVAENNAVTKQGDVLQSTADSVVDSEKDLNYNDNSLKEGEYSGIYQGQGLGSSDEETSGAVDSGKEAGVGGIYGETAFAFRRRTKETYGKNGRTVSHLNITVAYKEANSINRNSPAGVAYNILKSNGYNVTYCDGPILINNNKYTVERTQAVTIFDGTVYISSDSTLNGEYIALHEAVHVWQYGNNAEYSNYESIVFQEIDPTCEVYKKVASQINDNHYNGKYDIEDVNSFEYIMRELTAYINQYVCTNPKFARETFGGMFGNWENVVHSVYVLNKNLGFGDIIKEATSQTQVASFSFAEQKANGIDTDEFIKGLSGEKNELVFSQEYIDELLESFGITKPGDYIHVQKCVMETLEREGYFTDKENRCTKVVNDASGMVVEINKKGIKETFNLDNYARLGRFKKFAKLAVVRSLPKMIKSGNIVLHDVPNKYDDLANNKKFTYIECLTKIEGKDTVVKFAIKQSPQKNNFWVHSIYTIENVSDSPASIDSNTVAGHITADENSLSQNYLNVNVNNNKHNNGIDTDEFIKGLYGEDKEKAFEQGNVLQSTADGMVDSEKDLNYNDNSIKEGEMYAEDYQRTMGSFGREKREDDTRRTSGTTQENAETTREVGIAFQRRAKKTYGDAGRLVFHLNIAVAYKVADVIDNNSQAGIAYNILKSKGHNVVYCDGSFELNDGIKTIKVTEAITLSDGTIYISSEATLNGNGIALHEVVHIWQYDNRKEYTDYEDILSEEINFTSKWYEKLAEEINVNHYGGKYDIEDISSFKYIIKELSAYISQYVCTNPKFAREKFGGMFENWENVVQAVYKMNDKLGFDDVIKEATSQKQVASFNFVTKKSNKIDTDEFIKGLYGEDTDSEVLLQSSTNAVTKPLSSYAPAKRGMIVDFLKSVDEKLKAFVERVKNGSDKFERFTISDVSGREVTDIKNLLGVDVDGYTHNINTSGIRHILKRHGVSGSHDYTMSNDNDIARMGWVIKNYDNVEVLSENGEVATSGEFKDKLNRPAPQIRYSKKINGTYYVVEAVFVNDYNKLWVQSAYLKNEKEGVTQDPAESQKDQPHDHAQSALASPPSYEVVTPDPDAAQRPPMVTSETPPASPTSIDNISQSKNSVNDKYWGQKSDFEEDNMMAIIEAVYGDSLKFDDADLQSTEDGVVDSEKDLNYNDNNINKGENYNGEDTKLLGRGAVPAADTRDNILWESSTNSEALAACLGVSQRGDTTLRKTIRAGECSWLDEKPNPSSQKTRKSFKESVYRRIRGIKLSGKDTIGGTVSTEILEGFKNTICKDEKGNLISLYHWTSEIFETFKKGEFGFHFGTLRAANDRYLQMKEDNPSTAEGIFKEVICNISNPIELKDGDVWTAGWVAIQLYEKGIIGEQQYSSLFNIDGFYDNTYDNPAAKAVREILAQNGYDGIIYENLSEDVGSYSLIALYPEQIVTVTENGVLKKNSGVSRAISEKGVASFYSKDNIIDADEFIKGLYGEDNEKASEQGMGLLSSANGVVDSDSILKYNDNNINKGENYNGEDTELLGRGAVPAADTRDNILWESGTNSETIASFLEISQGYNVAHGRTIWAGESDWICGKSYSTRENSERYEQGVPRKIRRVKLSGKDTIGGKVSTEILERFINSICKDEKGNLISLYHWTSENFETFKKGEFGFHFGTLRAAYDRYLQTKEDNPNTTEGALKEVILNITNPIEMSDDNLQWSADWVSFQLLQKGVITERQYSALSNMEGFYDNTYDNPAAKAVREILAQNGYDGIIYENLSEDVGSYSLIALYPEQIVTVAENGVLKENSGISRAIPEKGIASFGFINNKINTGHNLDNISHKDFDKFFFKKPIKVSKKDWSKVNAARLKKYSHCLEEDIPDIDFFRIAEYNKINVAYRYYVRNYDKYNFEVISKIRIKEEKNNVETTNTNVNSNGVRHGADSSSSRFAEHGQTIQSDDKLVEWSEESEEGRITNNGDSDSRRSIDNNDTTKATLEKEVASFNLEDLQMSESVNTNEFIESLPDEENKLNFSKEYVDKLLDSFGITKPGDYIHVQKCVMETLEREGFFTDKENRCTKVVNDASGMVVEINKKGIKETFDEKNYANVGRIKKICKLVTIRYLQEIIKNGELIENDIQNTHKGTAKNKSFAYIRHTINVDGKTVTIQLDIKKSPEKNKFWVHKIIKIDSVSNIPDNVKAIESGLTITNTANDSVAQSGENVNANNNKHNNGIDTDEFIKGLYGEDNEKASEQGVGLLSSADGVVDSEKDLNYNDNNINKGKLLGTGVRAAISTQEKSISNRGLDEKSIIQSKATSKDEVAFSMPIGKRKKTVKNNVIELSKNNELSKQIGDLHGAAKYKVIQQYILDVLSGEEIVLSDGKIAVVDKSDALHIANKAANKKTAQISAIKEIVEKAVLVAEEESSKNRKFDYFYYYEATVEYDKEIFNIYLNVGRATNDGKNHIYDITNKIRDTANRINGLERPKPNEGYALTNGISNNSITENADVVNNDYSTNADKIEYVALNEIEQGYIKKICNKFGMGIVFEDLREMVHKGEILSPDGYIEKDKGIIHLNLYSENPVGFILKHEFTHFGEKSSRYIEFVKTVKKSKLYKKWITEKTGESDLRIAEYKYKQAVANAHGDIYGAADPKAQAEMIADFVGEKLFAENGSGLVALTNDMDTKQRSAVIQFVLDFISFLKKKLSGIDAITFELSRMEDRFNELLYGAKNNSEYDSEVKFSFGVTQKDINIYVDAAYKKENKEDYKKYALPTQRLINDVSDEIDVSDYVHALRDNDIRHIKNSHGEGTNEKYPVTSDDIKLIPWIVQNYDKVFVIKREKGKTGIIYIKVNEDGLIYFLEQVTTIYGNEPLLVNKQMIKTGIEDIPNLKGFVDAINKKESEAEFLADLKKAHEVYAQSVHRPHYSNIISEKTSIVNNNYSTNADMLDDKIRFSLKIKRADSTVEEIQDARNLTEEQAIEYLKQAKRGELRRETYIPIRKDTPATIIDTLSAVGIEVQDRSLIMQVRKAQQAMSATNNGAKSKKQGNNLRSHGMSAEQIVEIVNNLDNPTAVILQTNRYNQYGDELPDNVAVFVEYNNSGKEGVAIVEFDSSIDPQFIGKEYGDTDYHTVVTIFEPDIERDGMPFDYIEELLSNPDNYELEIVRRQPTRSATGEKHPNTSSELPSSDIIFDELDNVNNNDSTKTDILDKLLDNKIKNTDKSDDFKFSISKTKNMDWIYQIYGLYNKKGQISRSDTLVVEIETPLYLRFDGIKNLPLAIPLSVVTKATNGKDQSHSIKQENIIKLQNGIRNADIVIKNPERNSFVFLTNIKQDGYPILVSFLQDVDFDGDRVHKATSIHLQIDVKSMLEALPSDATVYLKNKKEFNDMVGVTNNLRSLAANIEFIDEILSQNRGIVNNDYSTKTDIFEGLEELNAREIDEIESVCNRLGHKVVFEDLREMKYRGETISPEGYIDQNNVIHINAYAENPLGFVFKHELTHYAENSDGYKTFVNAVKNSSLYAEWIKSKTGKEYSWDAEEAYRQMVYESQSNFKSIYDKKIDKEIIADFVGDMLFTYNGSGLLSIVIESTPKQRNVIVQWVLDFISHIKQILGGQKTYRALELSVLEDSFRCLLNDNSTFKQNAARDQYIDDDIKFCFIRCTDNEVIKAAEDMEKTGAKQYKIWDKFKVIRDGWGDWLCEVDIRNFAFFAKGTASVERGQRNPKIKLDGNIIEGKLGDFVRFKSLFKLYPQLKEVEVVIKYAATDYDTAKYLIDSNKLIIDKKLYDNFVNKNDYTIKAHIIREIQRMVQVVEERNIDSRLKNIERIRQEGFPLSLTEDRMLTEKEIADNFADMYEARVVEKRQTFKNILDKDHKKAIVNKKKMVGYYPHFNYDEILLFDDDNKLVTAKEYDVLNERHKLDNYNSIIYNSKIDTRRLVDKRVNIKPYEIDAETEQEILKDSVQKNSEKMKYYILDSSYQNRARRTKTDVRIRAGNSGYLDDSKKTVSQRCRSIVSQIYPDTDVELSGEDTAGRRLNKNLIRQISDTRFKDKYGNVLSFYMWNNTPIDINKVIKFGMEFTTFDGVLNQFLHEKQIRPYRYNGMFQEFYLNSVSPLVLDMNGWNTVEMAKRLLNENIITQSTFDSVMSRKTVTQTNLNNGTVQHLLDKIQIAGYDSIVFVKENGQSSVMVFKAQQIIPVAQKGIICNDEQISQTDEDVEYEKEICNVKFVAIDEQGKDSIAINDVRKQLLNCTDNTRKLIALTEMLTGANQYIPEKKGNVLVGSSGIVGDINNNVWEALSKCEFLRDRKAINVADYDTAGRRVESEQKRNNALTIFKDNNGRLLSLFAYKGRYAHDQFGIQLGTLDAARGIYNAQKENHHTIMYNNFLEYYVNMTNPYFFVTNSKEITPAALAKSLFAEDKISFDEYSQLLATNGCKTTSAKSPAAAYLKRVMWRKGIDGVIYMDNLYDIGTMGVIALYTTQLTPVSENGKEVSNNILSKADANESAFLMHKNNVEKINKELLDGAKVGKYNKNIVGLTLEQKQRIKEKTGWSDTIIDVIRSMEEAQIYIDAGLAEKEVNGRICLIRNDIDMDQVDKNGMTNRERIKHNKSPKNIYGEKVELHHIGQRNDGPLAELTRMEHHQNGNDTILHDKKKSSEIDRIKFNPKRRAHWQIRFEI